MSAGVALPGGVRRGAAKVLSGTVDGCGALEGISCLINCSPKYTARSKPIATRARHRHRLLRSDVESRLPRYGPLTIWAVTTAM